MEMQNDMLLLSIFHVQEKVHACLYVSLHPVLVFRFSTRVLMRSLWLEIMMDLNIGYCVCACSIINISVTVSCNHPHRETTLIVIVTWAMRRADDYAGDVSGRWMSAMTDAKTTTGNKDANASHGNAPCVY